jgi:hypothetical protein
MSSEFGARVRSTGDFSDAAPHIEAMAFRHPHSDATYRVIPQANDTYGVEVLIDAMNPTMVTGFASEPDAEAWIERHKLHVASGPAGRRWFKKGGK